MKHSKLVSVLFLIFSISASGQEGWIEQTSPYSSALIGVYAIDSLNVWAVGSDGLIIHTNDGGTTWDSIPNGAENSLYTVEFINADTGFVGGRDNGTTGSVGSNSLIQRTTDGGLTWEFVTVPGGSQNSIMDIDFVEGPPGEPMRGICVGGLAHVWVTNNYGETWEAASGNCGEGNFNSCYFADSITGWFVGTPSNVKPYTIMYTDDGCNSFVEQTDPNEIKLNGVCFGTDTKGVAVGNAGIIMYTSDGGATWETSPDGSLGSTWFSVFVRESGLAWAVDKNGKIAYSIDWGHSWELQESGVTEPLWEVQFINDREGWAVGGMSGALILHTMNGGISNTGIDNSGKGNDAYKLAQNYPNPFSSFTQIAYKLNFSGDVTLSVYDITGRRIRTLVDEFKSAGEYTIDFEASKLSDGLYIYELKVDNDFTEIKKMVLER